MLTGNNGKWYEPVDVILFDLQEIGSKTWTYMYTLADVMTACVEANNYYASKGEDHHVELHRSGPAQQHQQRRGGGHHDHPLRTPAASAVILCPPATA